MEVPLYPFVQNNSVAFRNAASSSNRISLGITTSSFRFFPEKIYRVAIPPSAINSAPNTKLESSDAKKTAIFAISCAESFWNNHSSYQTTLLE
jgi:hypothetical protein